MRMAIHSPLAEGLAPTFENEEGHAIPSGIRDLVETVRETCRLPAASAWHGEPGWCRFSGYEVGLGSERARGYARSVVDAKGAQDVLKALDVTPAPEERGWWFRDNGFAGMIGGFEGRDEQFMVVGTKSQARGVEGVLLGERRINLRYDAEEGLSLTYRIDAKMAYVLPAVRRKGLGRVLAASFGRMVGEDLEALLGMLPEGEVAIETYLYGEAQSKGGLALLHRIADEMDVAGDLTVGPGVHVVRDYGL